MNKTRLLFILTLITTFSLNAQNPFISEIHYDDSGGDSNEGVEVTIPPNYSCLGGDLEVILYNGNGGASYDTETVNFTPNSGTAQYIHIPISGIQNGGPDGMALACNGTLIEFLSYEGSFTATNGPASGTTSTDIGVSEGSGSELESLQLTDSGWTGPLTSSFGSLNTGLAEPSNSPDITLSTTSLTVSETGTSTNFDVSLVTAPTQDVTITISSADTGEGTVAPTTLTFTTANWNTPQSVTVTGVDDVDVDGSQAYDINLSSASTDADYNGLTATVSATTTDDDGTATTIEFQMVNPCGNDGDNEFIVFTVETDTDINTIAIGSMNDEFDTSWNYFWAPSAGISHTDVKAGTTVGSNDYEILNPDEVADQADITDALAELNTAIGTNTDVFQNPVAVGGTIPLGSTVILFLGGGDDNGGTTYFDDVVNNLPFSDASYDQALIYPIFAAGTAPSGYFSNANPRTQYLAVNGDVTSTSYTPSGSEPMYVLDDGSVVSGGPCIPAAGDLAQALPVELLYFNASLRNEIVTLEWVTLSEINNSHFEVEWRQDGSNFEYVGEVIGNGNSTEKIVYDFTHMKPSYGSNYYRLKQVDFDGSYEYSPIEEITLGNKSQFFQIRPTVSSSKITISPSKVSEVSSSIFITDITGKLVIETTLGANETEKKLNISTLAKGHYFVRMNVGNNWLTNRFVKR